MNVIRTCIVFIRKDHKILLGFNHQGFNKGKWTGFTGLAEHKEDIINCALRITREQSGLIIEKLIKVAKNDIEIAGVPYKVQVQIFLGEAFFGEAIPRGMILSWFSLEDIPFKSMWKDSVYWMPRVLKGEKVKGFFLYLNGNLIHQDVDTQPSLSY